MGPLRPLHLFLAFLVVLTPITSAQFASVLDPPTLASDDQPAPDNALFFPLNRLFSKKRIEELLVPSKLWSRQQQVTCITNYTACQGSQFCCPDGNVCCPGGICCGAGTYCTTIGGVQGCCRIGHICNQVTNDCTITGQVRCPNENFCCAAGDTCYRDANNNPRCSPSNVSLSGSVSIIPTPTPTSQSSNPTHSSIPLETQCRLKPPNSQGLLSRRRQPPAHPASKRRGWF